MVEYILDFRWAHDLSLSTARLFFMAFFVLITVFGLSMSREYVFRGAEDRALWRDLRLWVIVIMTVQFSLYLYF